MIGGRTEGRDWATRMESGMLAGEEGEKAYMVNKPNRPASVLPAYAQKLQ